MENEQSKHYLIYKEDYGGDQVYRDGEVFNCPLETAKLFRDTALKEVELNGGIVSVVYWGTDETEARKANETKNTFQE